MLRTKTVLIVLTALVLTGFTTLVQAASPAASASPSASLQVLRENFANPPASARPMVRWWWFGAAVEKPEILRELQQMKADGIGGAELAFVYPEVLDDPSKGLVNLPFLSPAMLDAVNYAQAQGRQLGLRIDVTLCSGWPYGGPATTLQEAAGRLRTVDVAVPPNASSVAAPKLAPGESLISASIVNSIARPATVEGSHAPGRGRNAAPPPVNWDAASAQPLVVSGNSAAVSPASQLRTALFFIASHTGQVVKRAAVGAEGWVLDPFSHQAVATHLEKVGEPLVKAFGNTPPYAIFSDSLEAYGADWTPNLPAEFRKRRGYDLIPRLPELVAGGTPEAEKVRHDWGRTLTELVNENYLTQINDWAIAHHTRFRSQTYGEPAVSFSSQNLVGLAEGEGPQWRAFSTLRWATSANHVFSHNVSSGETFTWLHSPVFRATPLDMKTEADIDFIMGENQLFFHGWPYSAPQVGEPGWSLYAAAVFNNHTPWHPVMPSVTRYITRISYLMRQGQPANQVAVLLPTDDAWASFSPSRVTVTGAMQGLITPALMSAILSAGYNVDYIDADAINKGGVNHQILVLPPTDRIPTETMKKIQAFAAAGGKVISVGRAPSLDAEGTPRAEITALSKHLFDAGKSTFVSDTGGLADALRLAVTPDFKLANAEDPAKDQLGFIRRKLPGADIYFVVNTGNQTVDTVANFGTAHKFAEEWNPDSAYASATANAQPIHLAPYESRVFVFSDSQPSTKSASTDAPYSQIADLSTDWKVTFTSTGKTETEQTPTDWTTDPATRHYSGEAVYSRDFNFDAPPTGSVFLEVEGGKALPGAPNSAPEHPALGANGLPNPLITRPGPGMHAYFEPPIREAALVTVNGQAAGALWHPPYRLDISKLLKASQNHIEIHVYNTALNAWSTQPPHDYQPLIAKYGDRFQMQDLDKVMPISSGLLGQVHLVTQDSKKP
ncbi:MAG TPA: glycosyl hydrolase [Terracidiphilus sp.]|nr:glycosyl hydrolase [Terracidiphilus sp.]